MTEARPAPKLKVSDKAIYTNPQHRPTVYSHNAGEITKVWEEREGEWWVEAVFTVRHWAPAKEWTLYCDTCKANGGWWVCEEYDRNCISCSCKYEHNWIPCSEECVWYEKTLD